MSAETTAHSIQPSIKSILESTHRGITRVQGATLSAQALILLQLASQKSGNEGGGPLLILFADDEAAAEFASDLETWSELNTDALGAFYLTQLPTWEKSPYSSIAPSIRTRLARISALSTIVNLKQNKDRAHRTLILSSIAALSQATCSPEAFERSSFELRRGAVIDSRENLIRRLEESGYLRVDPVDDPGTFGVRGDIIDVFPPDRDSPIRAELFGEEIEKIRAFDSGTQRASKEEILSVRIPPAREVLINSSTAARIRQKLKERADNLGVSRAIRDPLLESIHKGTYPDHCDAWSDFAYEQTATFWDYLPANTRVVWVDHYSCIEKWAAYLKEQVDNSNPEIVLPPVDHVYRWNEELSAAVSSRSSFYLDRVQLTEASAEVDSKQTLTHTVSLQENTDLSPATRHSLEGLEGQINLWLKQGFSIIALASTQGQLERIRFLLEERKITVYPEPASGRLALKKGSLSAGFRWPAEGMIVLTEDEILGRKRQKKQRRATSLESGSAAKDWSGLQALSDLSPSDAIVHIDHGIGLYRGLVRLNLSGAPNDFLQIEYADRDRLYLPVYRLNAIQKYVGSGESVALDKLGGGQFAKSKEKVKDAVKKLAIDLVQLYAERKVRPGVVFSGRDSFFQEFEAKFAFDETPDQLKAIDQTLSDMGSGRVMDRLICGDVGYGKTEIALRAAFRAVSDGKQVAVLVPTTVLAFQHEQTFRSRLKDYPIEIASVSRFKSAKAQKDVLASLSKGKVDIIIGTHRLLSKDVRFHDLGLIIVDEEHRFGVEHKERLKTLRTNTHVLTLTATPIPRTLHMALSGLRDISIINTPPVDRLPIRTFVSKFDEALITRAIQFELSRGGQVFFLHNRVQSIQEITKKIQALLPEVRIGVGHGQMSEGELEKVMLAFYQKQTNVLVSTTIIESGLDIPSANTIIINRADSLGLAQLYQIRGRVGRSQERAYAYLLIPEEGGVTEDAKKRLEVIQRFVELGSGFSVASHDLELRGGGDLLGPQQSGHIGAVGFDLYTELLDEAIRELESSKSGLSTETQQKKLEPEIKLPFAAFLSDEYIPDIHQRLSLYRRFSATTQEAEIAALEEELQDRFGPLPEEALNLLWMIRLKHLLARMGIEALTVGPEKASLIIGAASQVDPVLILSMVAGDRNRFQLTPDGTGATKLVAKVSTAHLRDLFFELESLLGRVAIKVVH